MKYKTKNRTKPKIKDIIIDKSGQELINIDQPYW